ncbi:TIR domain-containing protein [Nitrospira sp. T9]|uniref:TIR domain-containing protein n=1 Tax=unclassified Nitrospira TaxID=2652172 RepID=UPI003F9679EF
MPTKTNPTLSGNQPRIFLSYARNDGEDFARDLRQKLTDHPFSLWQDRTQMEGGKDWWDQILEALKKVEYMVLVMTEAALASPMVRKEWRQARQEGVGVIPVFGQPDLDLSQLPRWMRDVHWVNTDVPEQWTRFIRTLESPHQGTRVPFMADDLPADYVPRLQEFEELAGNLLDPQQEDPIAITAALKGAGGYGKTTLAKALCHDERIQDAFHDGILWVTLGEQPNIMAGLTKLYAALTEERPNFVDEEDASARLAEVLADKDCLMVIDDVWNGAHLRPFLRGGKRCARIITTRDSGTLPETARLRVPVDAMQQKEALELLSYDLPKSETVDLRALAARLGEWPFLLKLANGVLRERVNTMGQSLEDALAYVQKALTKRGLTAFDARNPVERYQAVAITLGASFEHLKEDELARYQELAIFPEDEEVPLSVVTKLWAATGGLDDFDSEELCTRLNQLSLLLRYDPTTQRIQLHDVVRTYLEERVASQLPTLHGRFLDAYNLQIEPVKAAKDPYLCRFLAYHLVKAERWDELKKLLLNVDWLYAKLETLDVPALLSDFEWLDREKSLSLVQGAISLSAHIVGKFRSQLIGQLMGRLQTGKPPEIQCLLEQARRWRKHPWLRPLQGSLIAPGGPLIRTLSGHSDSVNAVTVTPDGTRAISAGDDATCKVWDLGTGEEVFTLSGHSGWVDAVTVTPDGTRAISAGGDATCKVWDLGTGEEVFTLSGHSGRVNAVTVTPDGTRAISAGGDATCKVWDLGTGEEVFTLSGHSPSVRAVTVTPDGTRAISAGDGATCKVWDLGTGQEIATFTGESPISCCAVSPDGRTIVIGEHAGRVHILRLEGID